MRNKDKLILIIICGIFLLIAGSDLARYHYTASDFAEKAIGSILTQREGSSSEQEYQMLRHKSVDGIQIFMIQIGSGDQKRTGCATFVKNLFLPLYRLDYSYIQNQSGRFQDTWAVDNYKALYLVEVNPEGVSIQLNEPMLKKRILKFFAILALYFVVITICNGVRRGKIDL